MGDLISRSKLLKEIETWGGCVEALHEYISNMPTAYDVDAVVEQLEDSKNKGHMIFCLVPEHLAEEFMEQLMRRAVAVRLPDSTGDKNPDISRSNRIFIEDILICLLKLRKIKRRVR